MAIDPRAIPVRPHPALITALLLAGIVGSLPSCTEDRGPQPVRFAIMGHVDSETIHKEGIALHTHLEKMLGRSVSVQILGDYAQAQGYIAGAEADFAILSPLAYVMIKETVPAVELLARVVAAGSPSYDGAIIARAGSGFTDIEALRGKRICWVSTSSTSGYLYPRIFLRSKGLDPQAFFASSTLTGSHVASLRALQNGECDAAATYTAALDNAAAVGIPPSTFEVITRTGEIPLDPVVARPGLAAELKQRVRDALLAMDPATDNHLANVRSFLRWEGFIAVGDADYDVIREALAADRKASGMPPAPAPAAAPGAE